jgi:hypothetical protein
MPTCETCGNDYDKPFQVVMNGQTHTFDSFECAIHALAPTCKHCGTRIVGHGLEKKAPTIAATTGQKEGLTDSPRSSVKPGIVSAAGDGVARCAFPVLSSRNSVTRAVELR